MNYELAELFLSNPLKWGDTIDKHFRYINNNSGQQDQLAKEIANQFNKK